MPLPFVLFIQKRCEEKLEQKPDPHINGRCEAVSWPQPGPGSEENLKICKEIKYFMLLFLF